MLVDSKGVDVTKIDPTQVLVGQLLALMALFQTMPPSEIWWPNSLVILRLAVESTLYSFLDEE